MASLRDWVCFFVKFLTTFCPSGTKVYQNIFLTFICTFHGTQITIYLGIFTEMKRYSVTVINHFTRHVQNDTASFNWLMNNGYKELPATLDAIRDDHKAFKYLLNNKHVILAAFVNS